MVLTAASRRRLRITHLSGNTAGMPDSSTSAGSTSPVSKRTLRTERLLLDIDAPSDNKHRLSPSKMRVVVADAVYPSRTRPTNGDFVGRVSGTVSLSRR